MLLMRWLIFVCVLLNLFIPDLALGQGASNRFYSYSCLSLSGSSWSNSNFYIRSTVGQVNPTAAISSGQFMIRQGFQQPFLAVFQTIHKPPAIKRISLYPNPNSGNFKLLVELDSKDDYRYRIIDFGGRLISSGLGKSEALMVMDDLVDKPAALYFLQIYDLGGAYLTSYRVLVQ